MTKDTETTPNRELLEAVWAEARDLVRKLEGSSVQRFAVAAGDCKIEIERGAPAPIAAAAPGDGAEAPAAGQQFAMPPGGRAASGAFSFGEMAAQADDRIPVLAPLVGTFYEAGQPGAKAFVQVGDSVEPGQTVCIVEAMKLMNEVVSPEGGKVVELCVANGEPVEFDQVLMYLEPAGDE